MKSIFAFFTSLTISFGGLFGYLTVTKPPEPVVLSAQTQASPTSYLQPTTSPTLSPTPTPAESPTSSPTPTQTPKKTVTPKPTPTKTPSPTPTRSPSPSSTPTSSSTSNSVGTSQTAISQTSSPTPTPLAIAPANMEPFFVQYSAQYNVDKNTLEKIANCESHFNPNAVNGDYLGMFQFASSTWSSKRGLMGLDTNVSLRTNSEESIRTAAYTISVNGTSPWANCV